MSRIENRAGSTKYQNIDYQIIPVNSQITEHYFQLKSTTIEVELQDLDNSPRRLLVAIQGMSCATCVNAIETNVTKMLGVRSVKVS